jgi:hypothetical protein
MNSRLKTRVRRAQRMTTTREKEVVCNEEQANQLREARSKVRKRDISKQPPPLRI